MVFRQILGLHEVNVGIGNRLQIGIKSSPIMWFIPDIPLKEALWAGELRVQLLRSRLFRVAIDATYFHVSDIHGLKMGIFGKYGTDKLALHVGANAILVWLPNQVMDTCAGPVSPDVDGYSSGYDCGQGTRRTQRDLQKIVTANVGFEVRFWRHGKFFLDAVAIYALGAGPGGTIFTVLPGVRLHTTGFAADLGLGLFAVGDIKIPMPVVNLSYRF